MFTKVILVQIPLLQWPREGYFEINGYKLIHEFLWNTLNFKIFIF